MTHLLAVVPVPLGDLLAIHANLLSHHETLLDIPLVRVELKLLQQLHHLIVILALAASLRRKLLTFLLGLEILSFVYLSSLRLINNFLRRFFHDRHRLYGYFHFFR